MKLRNEYYQLVKDNKTIVIVSLVLTLSSNVLAVLIPLMVGRYYQLAFGLNSTRAQLLFFIPDSFTSNIVYFFTFFACCILFRLFTYYYSDYLIGVLGEKLIQGLRKKLYNAHMNIPMKEYNEGGTGKYLLRFTGDLNSIKSRFTNGVLKAISDVFLFVFALTIIGLMNIQLMYVMIMALLVGFVILISLHSLVYDRLEDARNRRSNLVSFVNRSFDVIQSIFVFNKQSTEQGKFDKYADRIYDSTKKYLSVQFVYRSIILAVSYSLLFVVLVFGYVNSNSLDASALLITIMLIMTLLAPMRRLFKIGLVWEKGKLSWTKYQRVLNRAYYTEGRKVKYKDQIIRLSDGTSLRPGMNVITRNEQTHNLIDEIMGVSYSEIMIGENYLSELDGKQWRKNVTIVDMRYSLIGRTVFECISYSRSQKRKSKAQKVLQDLMNIFEIDERLDLDARVGVNGVWLSEEQTHVLQYVRAILADKPIIIMNHPPSISKKILNRIYEYIEENNRNKMLVVFQYPKLVKLYNKGSKVK